MARRIRYCQFDLQRPRILFAMGDISWCSIGQLKLTSFCKGLWRRQPVPDLIMGPGWKKYIDNSCIFHCRHTLLLQSGSAMELNYLQRIAGDLGFSLKQVNNIFQLQSEGATIPFMARYRKEATGNLNEVQINATVEMIKYFSDLDKRKETVRRTLEGLVKLTPELKDRIQNCYDATELEDIYLPYRPKR